MNELNKQLTRIFALILVAGCVFALFVPTSQSFTLIGDWTFSREIVIYPDDIDNDLTDFPVYVFLDSSVVDWTEIQDDLDDIRFVDENDTFYDYEIESYTVNTNAHIWVSIPLISSTVNTYFYLVYGNTEAVSLADSQRVWEDYELTYHLFDTYESANGRTATKKGANEPLDVNVFVDGGQKFDGNDYMSIPAFGLVGDTIIVESWVNCTSQGYAQTILGDNAQWGTIGYIWLSRQVGTNALVWEYADGVNPQGIIDVDYFTGYDNTPVYVAVVANYTSETILFYRNGVEVNNAVMITSVFPSTSRVRYIGGYSTSAHRWNGILDETRMGLFNGTETYIEVQYLSMTNNLLNYGDTQRLIEEPEAESQDTNRTLVVFICIIVLILGILSLFVPILGLIGLTIGFVVLLPLPFEAPDYLFAFQIVTLFICAILFLLGTYRRLTE